MLAELNNKISSDGTNLSERLEDQLTGNFFGTIRYLPFEDGLGRILQKVRFNDPLIQEDWKRLLSSISGYDVKYSFWPKHSEGEIDLLLRAGSIHIGIEVKFQSGISSNDNELEYENTDYQGSRHQLSRYSRMLSELSKGNASYLLFLAPFAMMTAVEMEVLKRKIINPGVHLGFFSWQDVNRSLESITVAGKGKQLILDDLNKLLNKKGYKRYDGFREEILEIVTNRKTYKFSMNNENVKFNWSREKIKEDEFYVYHS
jgi:hypothetical protein